MAIVIPSKYIYSKSFDPVIDNQISEIEIGIKTPTIVIKNETVYKEELSNFTKALDKTNFAGYIPLGGLNGIIMSNRMGAVYVGAINRQYCDVQITINNYQDDSLITIGKSDYFNHTITGTVTKERLSNKSTINIRRTNGFYSQPTEITLVSLDIKTYNPEITSKNYSQEVIPTNISINYKNANFEIGEISAMLNLTKGYPTIKSIVNSDGSTTYTITINLLVGAEIIKAKFKNDSTIYDTTDSATHTLNLIESDECTKETYAPKVVSVNINGELLVLDLEDKTYKFGNGNKVFSFDGNELIQTTNTPMSQNKYQGIIDKWKNGKQTAVISCSIADYYDTNGNKVINISTSGKMLFQEGDIVIPYIYTNKGDKPLSYNKDFTPKQFRVIGTKISKNQGGMQDLTLQEI